MIRGKTHKILPNTVIQCQKHLDRVLKLHNERHLIVDEIQNLTDKAIHQ